MEMIKSSMRSKCPIVNGDTIVNCALHIGTDQKHISCISRGSESEDKKDETMKCFTIFTFYFALHEGEYVVTETSQVNQKCIRDLNEIIGNVLTSHLDILRTINKEIDDCSVTNNCEFACTVDLKQISTIWRQSSVHTKKLLFNLILLHNSSEFCFVRKVCRKNFVLTTDNDRVHRGKSRARAI